MDMTKSGEPRSAERAPGGGDGLRPVGRDAGRSETGGAKAAQVLGQLGGLATAKQLRAEVAARELRAAVGGGLVLRVARGRYALPPSVAVFDEARRLHGVVALRSAALRHGWAVKTPPPLPEVAVARSRRIDEQRRAGVRVLWVDLAAADVVGGVTSPLRTVVDCARHLPFDEALAIADSALRSGKVTRAELDALRIRGAGSDRVRRVLQRCDRRAANAFESVLRALCLEEGLEVEPQVAVDMGSWVSHPDLVCVARRIVIEGDSHTFHTEPVAFAQDCERYNTLVLRGWRVFRFTWEHVMRQPAYVRSVVRQLAGPSGSAREGMTAT